MIYKNTASQGLYVYAYDKSTGSSKTGDAANITANWSKDGAAPAATNDTNPTEIGGGVYWFDLTQAECNCNAFSLVPASATSNIVIDPVLGQTEHGVVDAQISSRLATAGYTAPDSASAIATAVWAAGTRTLSSFGTLASDVATAVLGYTTETGWTLLQTVRVMLSATAGKLSGAGTGTISIRDAGDSKNRIAATVDSSGNRTAITYDKS
jgi:hypothetical protein